MRGFKNIMVHTYYDQLWSKAIQIFPECQPKNVLHYIHRP